MTRTSLVCSGCKAFFTETPPSDLEVSEQGVGVCSLVNRSEYRCKNCDVVVAKQCLDALLAPYADMHADVIAAYETGELSHSLVISLTAEADRNNTSFAEELEYARIMVELSEQAVYNAAMAGFRGVWGMEDEETRKRVQGK